MRTLLLLLLLSMPVGAATGQAPQSRIDSLLDKSTADLIRRTVDSARAMGLPSETLTGLALEGASRHAAPARILVAVQSHFQNLISARRALGNASSPAELTAGAGAILSGVTVAQLTALRQVRTGRMLTVPLVVLADLSTRGVPVDTATRSVYVSLAKGMQDEELSALRRMVEQDIQAGLAPGVAAVSRLQRLPGVSPSDMRRYWPMTRNPTKQ